MAKMGQGLARLITRRAPGRQEADEAVVDAGSVAPHLSSGGGATSMVAPARVEPIVGGAPSPEPEPSFRQEPAPIADTIDATSEDEGFAELGDPLAVMVPPEPVALAKNSEAAGFVDASEMPEPLQGEALGSEHVGRNQVASEQLYSDETSGDISELDFIAETDPLQAPATPAYDPVAEQGAVDPGQAALEDPASASAEAASATADASPDPGENGPEPERAAPAGANRMRALFSGLAGTLGQKRVWIPATGIMVLSVVGGLSFMLVKTSNDKAGLEAELAAARQAAQRPVASPPVALIPPLLTPPAPPQVPQQTQPQAKPEIKPDVEADSTPPVGVESAPERVRVASASKSRRPVQMDCDVSDKASVSLNLLKCIESFNQASGQ